MPVEDARTPVEEESIFHGIAWAREKKGLPKHRDDLEEPYDTNEAWQDYLRTYRPSDMRVIVVFDDAKKFRIRRKDTVEGTSVYVKVASDKFRNGAELVPTYATVVERAYTWIADEFGWPPPPPPITSGV